MVAVNFKFIGYGNSEILQLHDTLDYTVHT